jgi:2-polyprenyl-3-methyl-5-hydroxy-6-metoxy-1,4-benzoquinol methylase
MEITMRASRSIWDMGELPFHLGPLPRPDIAGFPERLPFRVGFDDALELFTQVYDPRTMDTLREVYARGSQLGIPMGDQGLGKAYAEDFQGVIHQWLGDELSGIRLLEIGCGTGHLLGALAAAGARVSGVEPDPRCAEALAARGIPVATCALEDFEPRDTFDCIVHYCVLEHAPDPIDFLARQRALLGDGGRIVCAVPDCSEALRAGDVSIFVHQHWSYFTAASFRRLAASAGLRMVAERRARVGGLLYASLAAAGDGTVVDAGGGRAASAMGAGGPRTNSGEQADRGDHPEARVELMGAGDAPADAGGRADAGVSPEELVARGQRALARFGEYVRDAADAGRRLGIYCPTRAINYVPPGDPVLSAPRLFDDAPALLGKFVPPFVHPVESGAGLEREGVDEILIMSRSFGAAIERAIRARPLDPMPRIRHIDDVLRG